MDTVEVPLRGKHSSGQVCLIDSCDSALVLRRKWSVVIDRNTRYAVTHSAGKMIRMHRLLLSATTGQIVDHVNGNGLDNRRSNIRIATIAQNAWNSRVVRASSGFRGVYAQGKFWIGVVRVHGRDVKTAKFDSPEAAAKARDELALKFHGDYASTNCGLGLL